MAYHALLLALTLCSVAAQQLTPVQSKLDHAIYLYPDKVREERQLAECSAREVCSTEHQRYWLPTWVRRYCRCPTSACSERAASLDNRSHIKVCASDRDTLEPCNDREIGLERTTTTSQDNAVTKVSITCRCNWPAYWALAVHVENSTLIHDKYACRQRLKQCQPLEFCGHIRSDTYSVYVQCGCPPHHICLNNDRTEHNVTEALYQGPAKRAYCLPYKPKTIYISNNE